MFHTHIAIQTADFDVSEELRLLRAADARIGAVCSFVGTVRDRNDGSSVASMELEHYPGMTEKSIAEMVEAAAARPGPWAVCAGCLPLFPVDTERARLAAVRWRGSGGRGGASATPPR